MPKNKKNTQFDRVCRRFEIAVQNFGKSCFNLQANEKAFQAWFGAMVMQEFGISRVYREIHLPINWMKKSGNAKRIPDKLKSSQELFPDVSVSWEPAIDARHASTRAPNWAAATQEMVGQLAIISEMKVSGSTKAPTLRKHVVQDLLKLHLFAEIHREIEGRNLLPLATYMIIMDNNSDAFFDDKWFEGIYNTVAKAWPNALFDRPTTILISKHPDSGERVRVMAYRDGKAPEEI